MRIVFSSLHINVIRPSSEISREFDSVS
jgi:hypothetical protein